MSSLNPTPNHGTAAQLYSAISTQCSQRKPFLHPNSSHSQTRKPLHAAHLCILSVPLAKEHSRKLVADRSMQYCRAPIVLWYLTNACLFSSSNHETGSVPLSLDSKTIELLIKTQTVYTSSGKLKGGFQTDANGKSVAVRIQNYQEKWWYCVVQYSVLASQRRAGGKRLNR